MQLIYHRGAGKNIPMSFLLLAHGRNFFLASTRILGTLALVALAGALYWFVFRHVHDTMKLAVTAGFLLAVICGFVYAGWWMEMRYDMMLREKCPEGVTFIVNE